MNPFCILRFRIYFEGFKLGPGSKENFNAFSLQETELGRSDMKQSDREEVIAQN